MANQETNNESGKVKSTQRTGRKRVVKEDAVTAEASRLIYIRRRSLPIEQVMFELC
jgi:hypothetical protein